MVFTAAVRHPDDQLETMMCSMFSALVRLLLLVTFAYIVSIVSGFPSSCFPPHAAFRLLQPLNNGFVRLHSPLSGGLGLIPRLMLIGGKVSTSLRAVLSSLSLSLSHTQYVDS
jgi:hypothetical protein